MGSMEVELFVDVDGQASYNSVPFLFYGLCPENECNKGYCSFGRCVVSCFIFGMIFFTFIMCTSNLLQCYYGYRGNDCSEKLIAPMITSPHSTLELIEGKSFSYQLNVDRGSSPIEWTILGVRNGIDLDAKSGILTWKNPSAATGLVQIQVQATNELSRSDPVVLSFHVSPSYYVRVSTSNVSYTRPSPAIYFDFVTIDVLTNSPTGGVPAVLWVQEQGTAIGQRRKATVKTNSLGTFRWLYQPYSTDAGVFFYGGEHPVYNNLTAQGQFRIMGVDVIPSYYYFRGFPSELQSVENAFLLYFKGGSFSGIEIEFDQDSSFSVVPSLNSSTANSTSVSVSLNISSSTDLTLPVFFTISTTEGLQVTSAYVYMDVRYRIPKLDVLTSWIDVYAEIGGSAKYYDVELRNAGSLASNMIEVIFLANSVVLPMSEILPALAPDESTSVSLRVVVPDETVIGEVFTGVISFASTDAETAFLNFRVTAVSSVSTTLTIVTQSEATFFSEERPNLDYVDITVRSLTLGTVYTMNSGVNGTIAIAGMVEDFYEIIARKSRHKTFTKRILLESPGQSLKAFLSFESVSYKFYVVSIPVVDKYKLIVESTFTTSKYLHLRMSIHVTSCLPNNDIVCMTIVAVPKPVILWEPLLLDLESLRNGFIDSFHMSATNVGFIATDNLTFWFPDFWENVAFITPEMNNLGRLSANSTLSYPVEVVQINRYEIPPNRTEMRDPSNPNNVIFLPILEDARWSTGLDLISINYKNPTKQWYYKFDVNSTIEFVYSYSDRTRFDFIYDGVDMNGIKIPVNIVITNNTNLTETRRLFADVPPPVFELGKGRRLGKFEDCANLAKCTACEVAWGSIGFGGRIASGVYKGLRNSKVFQRYSKVLQNSTAANVAGKAYSQMCKQLGRWKEFAEVQLGPGVSVEFIETPQFLDWICPDIGEVLDGFLDPCQYICKRETVGGGCTEYECGGELIEICMPTLEFPDPGSCFDFEAPLPAPPCPRCGTGPGLGGPGLGGGGGWGGPGGGGPGGCTKIGDSDRRRLFGCKECSSSELEIAFRETDNRQNIFQEVEAILISCITNSHLGSKTLFPCIFRSTTELAYVIPLLSRVVSCQLDREVCYDQTDLINSPGLVNLFTQAKRFESMIDMLLLPYSGSLHMDPSIPTTAGNPYNYTQAISFGKALVDALADSKEAGEFISNSELNSILDLELTVPSKWDILQFATTWNQSLAFWNDGIFSSRNLPANYSDPFFDLEKAQVITSEFLSAREDIRSEHYSGFGDAWLTAVEGQQFEESKQLAGVCASVRVRIEQEMTLTRIGFEARLEIFNDGDSSLENITGERMVTTSKKL